MIYFAPELGDPIAGGNSVDPASTSADEIPTVGDAPAVDWRAFIPDTHRDATDWKKFKDGDDGLRSVLKSYAESEKMRGRQIGVPALDAGDEAWDKFFDRTRPGDVSAYDSLEYPDAGGIVQWNDREKAWIGKTAHELGMPPRLMQRFLASFASHRAEVAEQEQLEYDRSIADLRKSFGASWDRNIALANRALHHLGGDELLAAAAESGIGASPVWIRALTKLGNTLAESNMIVGHVPGALSPADAETKINEIRSDPKHAYWKGDKTAIAEVERLSRIAWPGDVPIGTGDLRQ